MKKENVPATMTIETIERQRQYVKEQKERNNGMGIVFAGAFLRGMRDIGYKSPAWSLAEIIDNSIQAAAHTISIRFGFNSNNKSQVKPDMIAICDNGNGMISEMISYAVRWGGTDRENDRRGFGRYGYGLPSASVSLAKRYTVYSKTRDSEWYAVTVDIEQLAEAASDTKKTGELLAQKKVELPKWLVKSEDILDLSKLESGTVIILEDIDRLSRLNGWVKVQTLETKLLQHFGVIYRNWIPEYRISVNGKMAQPVDPLFLMEHARFYNETPTRSIPVETRIFEAEMSSGAKGNITIRASLLPPNFQLKNPVEYGKKGAANNSRLDIMKSYNGLLICREKRQIDCIQPQWTKYQYNDGNIKIEVDFDPALDEYFGITTAKQQIVIDDEMWEKLKHSGKGGGNLVNLVKDLRARFEDLGKALKAKAENQAQEEKEEPRPSALAMQESEKFDTSPSTEPSTEQKTEAERKLDSLADEHAKAGGKSKEQAIEDLRIKTSQRKWEVIFQAIPEGPFYRPDRLGEQKQLIINTDHPFYKKIYAKVSEKAGLEVLLFVLADRELSSKGDIETFYKSERNRWSQRLRNALDILIDDEALANQNEFVRESMHPTED